ncbi:uncharacterized protein K452DRAFT_321006 [Aplosporella prunicola CBS 121167]|uniref:FAD/NAD(P)-binding domain-containing protein n=1 Tax=Aplosporella prunicola CBS 121167 TaxID=1176127 RepID=A0A6A6B2K7_9PEZI|nr:uncharacterized protein K452DRAFT_321006 [Aplosporella prunicola CBS 121167]KAF2138419.1 hypothetical protein K452DRAFT_321006 [Aplosporella prunicola CBS 121167]
MTQITTTPFGAPNLSNGVPNGLPPEISNRSVNGETHKPLDGAQRKAWISERCVDQPRPLKLIYIGAGVSGITGAISFLEKVPNLELVIYEKNPEVGGTWYENRYPGCACDVPSHSYQLSFESWPKWSQFFSGAPEILEYWKMVAQKYDVRKRIRFEQKCIGARWSETSSKWFVQIQNLATKEIFEDSADVLMTGEGVLNQWNWPDITGIHNFKGPLLHSASWDAFFNPEGKSVAVIGAGSSGIQIVPAILPAVKSMDHYVRGRTWIANQGGGELLKERTSGKGGNFAYTDEEKSMWENNREVYLAYRKALEFGLQSGFGITHKDHLKQKEARAQYSENMRQKLRDKPEIIEHLMPTYPPFCKRLTPGPGYLEALTSPKVNVIPTAISHIDETGIVTTDGIHHPVDVIICATGFQTTPGSHGFPIYGRDGSNLRERYQVRPETYLGLSTSGFPNFFQSLGPNAFQGAGNLLIMIEYTHQYVAQILARLAYGNIGTVEPKRWAVEAFTNYCDEFFKRTVFADECDSWYKSAPAGATREEKRRGRVTALWPGSSLHAVNVLSEVRWEDYESRPWDGNPFGWFGNGWTRAERDEGAGVEARTWYLNNTNILRT